MYVLLCCWVAAVGAGLLKSEEILEGVTRVSISNDLEFEEQNFIALMTEARQVGLFLICDLDFLRELCYCFIIHIDIGLQSSVCIARTNWFSPFKS